ncbi:MAG: 50S ribosomal protein L23 [Patescibacteria group bacterium]|jgi:large subunit ribosomal protein L23
MAIFNSKTDKKASAKNKKSSSDSMKDLYEEKADVVKKSTNIRVSSRADRVLLRPLVTEKATNLGELNQYVFVVADKANKIEVAKAIYDVYKVKPLSVNIVKVKGKKVSRGRISGRRKDFKKAVVTLKKGETISVYEGV